MASPTSSTRALSAAVFGNSKVAEVVDVLEAMQKPATSQAVALQLQIAPTLVRDVLVRLQKGGVLSSTQEGGSRAPRFFEPADPELWAGIIALADIVRRRISD